MSVRHRPWPDVVRRWDPSAPTTAIFDRATAILAESEPFAITPPDDGGSFTFDSVIVTFDSIVHTFDQAA